MRVSSLALLILALAGGSAQAASFPCDKAQAPDEKAICAYLPLNDRVAISTSRSLRGR